MAIDDDSIVQAAELVLGLLEGPERGAALRRVLAEPEFAREVEAWNDRFATLFHAYPEVAPPPSGAQRADAAIMPERRSRVLPVAIVAMLAAACLLLFFTFVRPEPPVPLPQPARLLIAALAPTDGQPPVAALVDANTGEIRVMTAKLAPQGKSAQLWVIASGEPPRSLGLLRNAAPTTLVPTGDARGKLAPGATLAVSIEPVSGSPTGLPTGPVVATGALETT